MSERTILALDPLPEPLAGSDIAEIRANLDSLIQGVEEIVNPPEYSACLIWNGSLVAEVGRETTIRAIVELCEIGLLPQGFTFRNDHGPAKKGLPHGALSRVNIGDIFVSKTMVSVPSLSRSGPEHVAKLETAIREIGLGIRNKAMNELRSVMLIGF